MKDIVFKTLMLKGEAGATIISIDKLEAEGGSWIMRVTLSDGSTVDFPVTDVPDTDLIESVIKEALALVEATLLVNGWSSSAPYTYTLTVEGVTDQDDYEILGFTPTEDPDDNNSIKEALSYITYGVTSADTITFYAVENKPTIDIPIILRKVVS